MAKRRVSTATEQERLRQFLGSQRAVGEVTVSAPAEDTHTERVKAEFALSQMELALAHVRALGAEHQYTLVAATSAIYCCHWEDVLSMAELYALFGAMEGLFAEKAVARTRSFTQRIGSGARV